MTEPVYLDYNATTPLDPEVLETITETLKCTWANPSSNYESGRKAKAVIENARKQISKMIGADESEIIFTSGGTEANNMVLHSAIQYFNDKFVINSGNSTKRKKLLPHIITSNIEHDSIVLPLQYLKDKGIIDVTFVPVSTETGRFDVDNILNNIQPNTCLIAIMLANNETGIIQPISSLGKCLIQKNYERENLSSPLPPVLLHTDAAQALGKIPVNVDELHVHYLTIVGHKFYGPRIGAVYFCHKKNVPLSPIFYGGGQEKSYRPGTENTGMIAGLGKAAELVTEHLNTYQKKMAYSRDYLENKLKEVFGELIHFNNHIADRLPNTCSVSFKSNKLTGHHILAMTKTLEASVGAACHSNTSNQCVLVASGIPKELAVTTLRLTTGRETTTEDIDKVIADLKNTVKRLQNE